MVVSWSSVGATPAVLDVRAIAVPVAAASAACVIADVSTLDSALSAAITFPTFWLVISWEEPSISPFVKSAAKASVALVRELAPVRTLPMLMMLTRLPRSRAPVALKIW